MAHIPETEVSIDAMLSALAYADPFHELRGWEQLRYEDFLHTDLQYEVFGAVWKAETAAAVTHSPWAVGPIGNILVDPITPRISALVGSKDSVEVSTYLAATAAGGSALGISLNDATPSILPVAQAFGLLGEMMRWASTLTGDSMTPAQITDLCIANQLLAQTCARLANETCIKARFEEHQEDEHLAMITAAMNRADPDHAPF